MVRTSRTTLMNRRYICMNIAPHKPIHVHRPLLGPNLVTNMYCKAVCHLLLELELDTSHHAQFLTSHGAAFFLAYLALTYNLPFCSRVTCPLGMSLRVSLLEQKDSQKARLMWLVEK
jgi:hypothetical protein